MYYSGPPQQDVNLLHLPVVQRYELHGPGVLYDLRLSPETRNGNHDRTFRPEPAKRTLHRAAATTCQDITNRLHLFQLLGMRLLFHAPLVPYVVGREGGRIVWHDYGIWDGVTKALAEVEAKEQLGLKSIHGTSLVYWKNAQTTRSDTVLMISIRSVPLTFQ